MKNLLIFNSGSFVYGAERGVVNLIRGLKEEFRITLVLPENGPLADRVKASFPGVEIKIFPLPILMFSLSPFYWLGFILRTIMSIVYFIFYVRQRKIDIISTNTLLLLFPSLVAKITKKRHIWHIREFFPANALNKYLGIFVNIFSGGIIFQSKTIKEKLFIKGRGEVIYEPLSRKDYNIYDSDKVKKELGLPLNSIVISIISRLHQSKGQYEFIQRIKTILWERKDLFLLIVGDITPATWRNRTYRKNINNFILDNKLDNVIFLSYKDSVDRFFSVSDLCVFPFLREEPFGIAVAESLAFGNTTLFPRKGGLREVAEIFQEEHDFDFRKAKEEVKKFINSPKRKEKQFNIPDVLSFSNYKIRLTDIYRQ